MTQLKKVESDLNEFTSQKVKIVEEGRVSLKDLLTNPAPNKEVTCVREKCQVCRFKGSKGGCKVRSVCYAAVCLDCQKGGQAWTYWGETLGTMYERALQHVSEGERCLPESHIWQHLLSKHPEGL